MGRGLGLGSEFIADTRRILEGRSVTVAEGHTMAPAAVLLTLYNVDDDFQVVLQKRSQQVEHHKGEISFPGGMADPEDESLLQTALREAHEEMGIAPGDVDVLGRLDDTPTITGFMISTYVGVVQYPYPFVPSSREVAEVLTVPLSHLRTPGASRVETHLEGDSFRTMPVFVHNGHVIFGATARILDQFLRVTADLPV